MVDNFSHFTWIPFYMELADKLKIYRIDRTELIQKIKNIYDHVGKKMPTLEYGELIDIDPFTIFGLFNKKLTDRNRIALLNGFANEFDIVADVPTDFIGIPVMNPLQAAFYGFGNDRKEDDIDNLWAFFIAALDYADNRTGREEFCRLYNIVIKQYCVSLPSLSMGLFWVRPYKYLNFDGTNKPLLRDEKFVPKKVVELINDKMIKRKNYDPAPDAEIYLQVCELCLKELQTSEYEYKDFPSLSYYAWKNRTNNDDEEIPDNDWFPSPEEYTPGLSVEDSINNSNTWLLTYNPSKWNWDDYENAIRITQSGAGYYTDWSISSKQAQLGDRVYIIRLGDKSLPKGIFATGFVVSNFYDGNNFDMSKNTKSRYVDVLLTTILDYRTDNIITLQQLKDMFPQQRWDTQSSGISIKPDAAEWLIDNWNKQNIDDKVIVEENSEDTDEPVIWKISHGTNQTGVPKHLRSVLENKKIVIVNKETYPLATQTISQGQTYMKEIKKGDFFYLCYAGEIVLFGQFTEDEPILNQEMVNEINDYNWYERSYKVIAPSVDHNKYTGIKKWWTPNFNSTCVKVTDNQLFEELILTPYFGLKLSDLKTGEYHEPYTKQDFLKDVYITEPQYDTLKALLERKKNIILQGAPGVGKTFAARRLAWSVMGEKDNSRIELVQFHQSYSYEDFIMGYRPNDDGNFEIKEGVFYRFCQKARNDPDRDHFFIIDEINRGNLSKIFGELLMLIEKDYRNEPATLAYREEKFSVPENLYIIGMMNTADRSLAMIDYALRRRFSFYTMTPAFDNAKDNGFGEYMKDIDCELYRKAVEQVARLNEKIRKDTTLGKGFEIGHSYFSPTDKSEINDDWVKNVIAFEIVPLIEEYWFDDEKKAEEEIKALYDAIGEKYDGR